MSTSTNSFLRGQRKTDLLELAETVGLKETDGLKKADLEVKLDEYLAENQSRFGTHPKATPYYQSRARAIGSPVKKELPPAAEPKMNKRRAAKTAEQNIATTTNIEEEDSEPAANALVPVNAATPGRALALARNISLPATPAEVARVVDERTVALRERVSSLYEESGLKEVTYNTRSMLSTVSSIILCINAFELYHLRKEVLADRYAFTIPGVSAIGTSDYAVQVPDMFLLLTSSFWNPTLLWILTSVVVPSFFGFYFNLSAAHQQSSVQRKRGSQPSDNMVDPLIYSLAKAVITYVVYQQGVTLGGWIDPVSVARINSAVYGGWKGVITGSFISGVASFYDAVLSK